MVIYNVMDQGGCDWRACCTYERKKKSMRGVLVKPEGKDHLEDLGVDGEVMVERGMDSCGSV